MDYYRESLRLFRLPIYNRVSVSKQTFVRPLYKDLNDHLLNVKTVFCKKTISEGDYLTIKINYIVYLNTLPFQVIDDFVKSTTYRTFQYMDLYNASVFKISLIGRVN